MLSTNMSALLDNLSWDNRFTAYYQTGLFPSILNRVAISGYSRSGKTTLVERLCNSESITFHPAMPLDDLIGGMSLVNSSTVWLDGTAVRALRNGSILQINEADRVPIECETFLYALMDDPAAITLPTGERVKAAPGYGVVFTMNPLPDVLPHPIYDRFDIYLLADTLSAGTKKALGDFAKHAEKVIGFNQPSLDWSRPASVNAFLAASKMRKVGLPDEKILEVLGWTGNDATDFLTVMA